MTVSPTQKDGVTPSDDGTDGPVWIYPKVDSKLCQKIIKEFRTHPVIAQVLVSRGFDTFEEINRFLYSKLPDLHAPELFPDMAPAVEKIINTIENSKSILIYGDNDVDGMTGTALLVEILRAFNAKVFFYIPDRTNLRESLILDALQYAKQNECKLLITVDCGITAAENIKEVVEEKVDVIITDHHEPTTKIPHCIATLNPKLVDASYPNRELTGVGVAFKLAHALVNKYTALGNPSTKSIDLKEYLDLVALGTVSDMGALLDENRILVRYGINQLRQTKRIGLVKLLEVCDIDMNKLSVSDIASKIAPRLNSLGRIADPRKGVELLLIRDVIKAEDLALELDLNNTERQKIERQVSKDVDELLAEEPSLLHHKAIVLSSTAWHSGVIPIVSTRITKTYNRPTIIIAIEDGVGKGSIRSIREFPVLPILKDNAEFLLNFGGHDYAAGLTIKEKNIEKFKECFIKAADALLKDNDVLTKLPIDAKIDFDEINFDFMESLKLLGPHGNENYPPILYSDVKQSWSPKVVGENHLKIYVEQNGRMLEGIAFGMAEKRHFLKGKDLSLRIAFTPQINNFLNKTSIQLLIRDFQIL